MIKLILRKKIKQKNSNNKNNHFADDDINSFKVIKPHKIRKNISNFNSTLVRGTDKTCKIHACMQPNSL